MYVFKHIKFKFDVFGHVWHVSYVSKCFKMIQWSLKILIVLITKNCKPTNELMLFRKTLQNNATVPALVHF